MSNAEEHYLRTPLRPAPLEPIRTGSVVVRHNFETAHRLPFMGGKCTNLHGHSWWVEVTVAGQLDADGVLCEFGALKGELREWVDAALDHGTMLGIADPLLPALLQDGTKVHVFGDEHGPCFDLPWPTVENVATLLHRIAAGIVGRLPEALDRQLHVRRVHVQETHVNAAECP